MDNNALSVISTIGGSLVGRTINRTVSMVRYDDLREFPNSKFRNYHNNKIFEDLKESINTIGLQQPIIVRKIPDYNKYIILAGHHRARAMNELGQGDRIPAFVLENITDEQALFIHLDTNGGRSLKNMSPSEITYLVTEKIDLIDRVGGTRNYLKEAAEEGKELLKKMESGEKILSRDVVASETGLAPMAVYRYSKLKNLTSKMMALLDDGLLSLRSAVVVSDLREMYQDYIWEIMVENEGFQLTVQQAEEIRKAAKKNLLTASDIEMILGLNEKKAEAGHVEREEDFSESFPESEDISAKAVNVTLKGDDIISFFPDLTKKTKKEVAEEIKDILYFYKLELPYLLEHYQLTGKPDVVIRDALAAFAYRKEE